MFQAADPAQEIRAQHEVVVRFVLDDMTHAHEFPVIRQFGDLFLDPFRTQIDPADDASDRGRVVGKREEPERFLHGLLRLNGDRSIESRSGQ